jgi:hypothetical protein
MNCGYDHNQMDLRRAYIRSCRFCLLRNGTIISESDDSKWNKASEPSLVGILLSAPW